MGVSVFANVGRDGGRWRRTVAAGLTAVLLATFVQATAARAGDAAPPADRAPVVHAWQNGGTQVRAAAQRALLGGDPQIRAFLDDDWRVAQQQDERDAVVAVIADGGPSVRAAAKRALDAADAGDATAVPAFLNGGWRQSRDVDTRVQVNQLMAAGGEQVRRAAQAALDSQDAALLRTFLDSGWQSRWLVDQRLRVNQAMATGGAAVKAAGQRTLDAGTVDALESFLDHGWAVAAARDQETASLTALRAQARTQGDLAEQETRRAVDEAAKAREAAEAARRAAAEAARATEAAGNDVAEAAAQAQRAAVAAQQAAAAAKVAVQAAASANRAARSAAAAAQRAAAAASGAEQAAAKAYHAAAAAATDASKAGEARSRANEARETAHMSREFAAIANAAGEAVQAGMAAVEAATSAAGNARLAADANDEAVRHAQAAGANASAAVAAAQQARADAARAVRAANTARNYLQVAADAAFRARDAANRAAGHAEAAAVAAIEAADHAGEAAEAARRSTEAANAATAAAQAAVETAGQAIQVFDAARAADAERLAVVREQGIEAARQAAAKYDAAQQAVRWDAVEAERRDAETNRLIAEASNPATEPATAVAGARQVALNLSGAQGVWTREAATTALAGTDAQVLDFVRTGIARAAGQDDRVTARNIAVTDNPKLRDAALAALAGGDAEVAQFVRTQNYPGRYNDDRLKVNQVLAAARTAGDVVLAQRAQEALDTQNPQTLQDFLAVGQHAAAATGQRVQVNQILAAADSGPETKAAAQIALDGPPPALRQFLTEGRFAAAERDHAAAAHLAVVAGLVQQINQIAQISVQNAMQAQEAAARARSDAGQAAEYAAQAASAAQAAARHATQADQYADQAAQSVEKAAAAVRTAKDAATRATTSARQAVRSASWAVVSHEQAVRSANEAHAAAQRAYDSAVTAGEDADAAVEAANNAYRDYEFARGVEISACHSRYASGAAPDLEKLLAGTQGDWFGNCVANVIADPAELAGRAYRNASFCGNLPAGSDLYHNCIASVLAPDFTGNQTLILLTELVNGITAVLIPVAAVLGVGCVVSMVCGAVAGTLLTIGEVGLNIYKLINGDQSLAQTLLKLGAAALESLLFAGLAKLLGAGFQAAKELYALSRAAQVATEGLRTANFARLRLNAISDCRGGGHSFDADTRVLMANGTRKPISRVRIGEWVLATDPVTGRTAGQPVEKRWRHEDVGLTDVRIAGGNGSDGIVRTTAKHRFWSATTRAWTEAGRLSTGTALATADGSTATVAAVSSRAGTQAMYDLTVAGTHTYYVVAGTMPVLVHNCGGAYDWKPGNRPNLDTSEQGPLPADSWIEHGEDLVEGPYHYVVMRDGSLRAIRNDDMHSIDPSAGHTSLADKQPVHMAGEFQVNESGHIAKFDNWSGHYGPQNIPGFTPLEDIARAAFERHGLPAPLPGAWRYYDFDFGGPPLTPPSGEFEAGLVTGVGRAVRRAR